MDASAYRHPVVFDLETVSIEDASSYVEAPSAPANYKDPEKIAAYVNEKHQELIARAALDPDLTRIVAFGVMTEQEPIPCVHLARTREDEIAGLRAFWEIVGRGPEQAHLVGFGILSYDLPVLLRRSQYLGVPSPPVLIEKYRHPPGIFDLMDELSFHGLKPYHSLNFYIRRFALGPFEEDITGKGIGLAVTMNDWVTVERHCRVDVEKTAALARRLGRIQ
jgi:hypothetical protein